MAMHHRVGGEAGWGGGVGWVCVFGGEGGGGVGGCVRGRGARVRMCPCGYFTLICCKHTLVGSTLHFTESKKLSL